MRRARLAATAVALATAFAGCTLAPRYRRPEAPVAPAFPAAAAAGAGAPAAADLGWRDVFGDPRLQALVALALERNRNLRVATLNVELVRAQYRIQRAAELPTLIGQGGGTVQRVPASLSPSGKVIHHAEAWSVGAAVTGFELDLWGRVRSLSDAALEQWFATDEARRSAQLSLVAEVANQYLASRALDAEVALARSTLETVSASAALTRRAAEAGRVADIDLRTAESQVATARFNVAAAEQQRALAQDGLELLVGGPIPATLPEPIPLDAQPVVADLPAGIPSEVLVRRPDVLAAEHALRAANANIGAARAAFFPRIALTGTAGTASNELSGLFGAAGGAAAWSFTPSITLPIFAGGALRANLDAAEVRKSIQIAQYEGAIQGAFREVADALVSRGWLEQQLEAQTARVAAEQERFRLSDRRYRAGIDSYLTVLTAQRDLFAAQQQLIQTRLSSLANRVALYKALGGGWRERTAAAADG
ncbi:MAG TPA: efflux transporter outer membrane subunit [Anaeromyxobacter sp.]